MKSIENKKKIEDEYVLLKNSCFPMQFYGQNITEFWLTMQKLTNTNGGVMFGNLSRIVLGMLTFPHSTAVVERVFHCNNLSKTTLRHRLNIETCSNILMFQDYLKLDVGSLKEWVPSDDILYRHEIFRLIFFPKLQ